MLIWSRAQLLILARAISIKSKKPGGVTDTKKGAFRGSKEAVGKPKSILFFLQVSVLGILENIEALLKSTCNYFTALVSKSIACCKKFVFFVSIFLFVVLEDKPMAIVQNIATNLFLLFTISPISCVVRSLILLFKSSLIWTKMFRFQSIFKESISPWYPFKHRQ